MAKYPYLMGIFAPKYSIQTGYMAKYPLMLRLWTLEGWGLRIWPVYVGQLAPGLGVGDVFGPGLDVLMEEEFQLELIR